MFPTKATNKGLISKIYKHLMQTNITKTNNPIKKLGRRPKQTFLQRRYKDGQDAHEKMLYITTQLSSVAQSCPTLCDPMDCSKLGFSVHHQLPELDQIHVHWVSDAIQPAHPLSSPSPSLFYLSQHQGLFQWVSSSHQVAKVLELQHQSFQWIGRIDFL